MRRGGMLPRGDLAGHDTLPHERHQDTMFRGHPAGPGCTPTTPHITAWRLVWWTGSMRSAFGSTCIRCLPRRVIGLGHLHLLPMDLVKMSKTHRKLATGSRRSFMWRPCGTPAPWPTWWPMLPVNLPREPSTAWKSRRTYHRTTLTWMPSWTTAGMGTPHSTWLSGLI